MEGSNLKVKIHLANCLRCCEKKTIYHFLDTKGNQIRFCPIYFWIPTYFTTTCRGRQEGIANVETYRDRQRQTGTYRDRQRQAGTSMDRQGQVGTSRGRKEMSLFVPVCPCLSLPCPCLSLLVPACPYLSLFVPGLSLALTVIIGK